MLGNSPQRIPWGTGQTWRYAIADSPKVRDPFFGASVSTFEHGQIRLGRHLCPLP
ncbi:hypothetical protein AKJ09_05141 [Labilithrix luteola]|uniref:Uncharacterized protein n=1 Tax=Labilithrix luteola TaxID=1391654 RepID=A0A0K1PY92_9BACT|nr:hypothetical protein AKJ09_05141 [Labilithrix luteola]